MTLFRAVIYTKKVEELLSSLAKILPCTFDKKSNFVCGKSFKTI